MESENRDDCTVFVGNLDEKVSEEMLFELFLQAGPVKKVRIPIDRQSGRQQRFGFVTFKQHVSVTYAIELLNGIQLHKQPLKLNVTQKNRNFQERNDDRSNHHNQFTPARSMHDLQEPMHGRPPNVYNEPEAYADPHYHPNYNLPDTHIPPRDHFHETGEGLQHHTRTGPWDRAANFDTEHHSSPFNNGQPPLRRNHSHHHSASPVWNHDKHRNHDNDNQRHETPPFRNKSEIVMHYDRSHGRQHSDNLHEIPARTKHRFMPHSRDGHRSSANKSRRESHLHQQWEESPMHQYNNYDEPRHQERMAAYDERHHEESHYHREIVQDHQKKRRHRPHRRRDHIHRE